MRTPLEEKHPGVDRRLWFEAVPRQPPHHGGRVPRAPEDAVQVARPWQRALDRDAPLDDHICADEWDARIVEQMPQDRRAAVEREVRNDAERLARKRDGGRIRLDDVNIRPSTAKALHPERVELDCDHVVCSTGELPGKSAATRAEIEHKIIGADSGGANDVRGKRSRAKEALATRAARLTRISHASLGHGPSPL